MAATKTKLPELPDIVDFLVLLVETCDRPDCSEALRDWLQVLGEDLEQGFLAGRSPEGEPWPLIKRPRRPAPPHRKGLRPLLDFGWLWVSVSAQGPGHVEEVREADAIFGTSVKYAQVHQTGSEKKHIPARPFIGSPPSTSDRLAEMVADSIMDQIRKL